MMFFDKIHKKTPKTQKTTKNKKNTKNRVCAARGPLQGTDCQTALLGLWRSAPPKKALLLLKSGSSLARVHMESYDPPLGWIGHRPVLWDALGGSRRLWGASRRLWEALGSLLPPGGRLGGSGKL